MAFEKSKTELGYEPSLAIFEKPSVNTGILSHKWIRYQPISQTTSGVVEFSIPGTSNRYINLKCSTLQITGKIVNEENKKITAEEKVTFVNAPLHSLWSQIDLALQQKVISSRVGTNYPYKAYLDLLLNSSVMKLEYQLISQLFVKDLAGLMDTVDTFQGGALIRSKVTEESKIVQIEGPLCLDLCEQDRYILNAVPIHLKLWPNKANFYLLTNEDKKFQFEISNIYLNVCTVEVSPAILVGHAAGLKIAPALYPFSESYIKTHSIAKGSFDFELDNIFQGDIPSEVLVGLVSAKAFNGDYKKNPFNFQHFNCNFCALYIDGESVPREPLRPSFESSSSTSGNKTDKKGYTEAYLSLYGDTYHDAQNILVKYNDYPKGYCLYRFSLNENNEGEEILKPSRRGHTRLSLTFDKALTETVNIIVYARFPRILQIDETRNVFL